jgi:hypothetical protein
VPDTRPALYKVHGQTSWNLSKKSRETHLAEIFTNAKKEKGKRPACTDYQTAKALDYSMSKSITNPWNKEKRASYIDNVQKREKSLKGPADYKSERKHKIKGNYLLKERSGQFMDEIHYTSNQSPGSNAYKPDPAKLSSVPRQPRANLNRDKSERKSVFNGRKGEKDLPGPNTYKGVDDKWTKMSGFKVKPNYSFSKTKLETYVDQKIKVNKKVPGAGHYKDNIEIYDKISRGASPHYKRGI